MTTHRFRSYEEIVELQEKAQLEEQVAKMKNKTDKAGK